MRSLLAVATAAVTIAPTLAGMAACLLAAAALELINEPGWLAGIFLASAGVVMLLIGWAVG